MNSKEALKEWLEITIPYSYWLQAHDYKKIIEQDLDRLDKLEKAIEILKGRICVHNQYICYDAYADIRLKDNEIELLEEVFNYESCNI